MAEKIVKQHRMIHYLVSFLRIPIFPFKSLSSISITVTLKGALLFCIISLIILEFLKSLLLLGSPYVNFLWQEIVNQMLILIIIDLITIGIIGFISTIISKVWFRGIGNFKLAYALIAYSYVWVAIISILIALISMQFSFLGPALLWVLPIIYFFMFGAAISIANDVPIIFGRASAGIGIITNIIILNIIVASFIT